MSRKLIVEIVGDSKSLERSFSRSSSSAKRFERDVAGAGRGAIAATVGFRGLGRAALFASSSVLGGAGLGFAFKSIIDAGLRSQSVLANTKNAVEASGNAWADYATQIDEVLKSQSKLSAFDDEDLSQSFALLVRGTGDVNKALRLNGLAADVARGRHMGLVQAAQLLVRVQAGQTGSLRRLGIEVKKGITGTQALDAVQRQYAGAAAAYGNTAAGSIDRLHVQIENTEESIAKAFLPTVTKASQALADFLGQPSTQNRIQADAQKTADVFSDVSKHLGEAKDTIQAIFNFNGPPKWWSDWANEQDARAKSWISFGLIRPPTPIPGLNLPAAGAPKLTTGALLAPFTDPLSGLAAALKARGTGAAAAAPTSKLPFQQFQLATAEATKQRKDDEQVLRVIVAALRARLGRAHTLKSKTEIVTAINQYQGQLQGLLDQDAQGVKDAADALKQKRQDARDAAKQALDDLAASTAEQVRRLREQAAQIKADDRARRSQFQTPLGIQLAEAKAEATGSKKGLRSAILDARKSARAALKSGNLLIQGQIDAWNTIKDANDRLTGKIKQDVGTKFHKANADALASGLGLSGDAKRELRARLSRVGANGTEAATGTGAFGHPIIVQSPPIYLDGRIIANSTTKHQQTRARRNPPQKRGPHGI